MKRIRYLTAFFIFLFALVILRLIDLQVIHHRFYQEKSHEQRTRIIDLASRRGDILSSRGELLATSIDTFSLFTQDKGFHWVARKLTSEEAGKIKAKDPERIFMLKEKKRVYPKSHLAAQVIGFIGMDNQGLAGIELAWDKYLKGKEGRVITEGDPEGRELYGALREIDPGEDGMNMTLSIDDNIQYIAEKEIEAQIKRSRAISGMLIVMDAKTGELLALASKPDFNPNAYAKYDRRLWHPRFLDPYEPGSTFKVITTASALDEGVVTPDTKLKALDQIEVGGKVIGNSHQVHWPGKEITISKMLEESINTGAVQLGLKLGPEKFYRHIKDFGFGEATGFGMEGESRGIIRYWKYWDKPDVAMLTFGQSIAVTPMQMLSAFSAFANDGRMVQPCLVKKVESNDECVVKTFSGEERGRAIGNKTAAEMKLLLQNVVQKGSGRRAKMEWFSVGGKTGTAQKAVPGGRGYMKGHYIASFIGMAPLRDPRIIALVIVDDPKGSIWGESVCGPLFKNVVEYSLRYLNVRPDVI